MSNASINIRQWGPLLTYNMLIFPTSTPIISFVHELRSRYSETDKMGYVYHGKFLEYFEVARVEMIREYGLEYSEMEDSGIMLPVVEANVEFKAPVLYDEPIEIEVLVYEKPSIRLKTFYHVIAKERDLLCARAQVTLFFMNAITRKPTRAPAKFLDTLDQALLKTNA